MKPLTFEAWFTALLLSLGTSLSLSAAEARPNIIYIIDDELGYYEPGFMGSQTIQTPNLDKMAAGGNRLQEPVRGRLGVRAHALLLAHRQT